MKTIIAYQFDYRDSFATRPGTFCISYNQESDSFYPIHPSWDPKFNLGSWVRLADLGLIAAAKDFCDELRMTCTYMRTILDDPVYIPSTTRLNVVKGRKCPHAEYSILRKNYNNQYGSSYNLQGDDGKKYIFINAGNTEPVMICNLELVARYPSEIQGFVRQIHWGRLRGDDHFLAAWTVFRDYLNERGDYMLMEVLIKWWQENNGDFLYVPEPME